MFEVKDGDEGESKSISTVRKSSSRVSRQRW